MLTHCNGQRTRRDLFFKWNVAGQDRSLEKPNRFDWIYLSENVLFLPPIESNPNAGR